MNRRITLSRTALLLTCALAVAALNSFADPVQSVTLQNANSVAKVDVGSSMGMYQWTVNEASMLKQQWFWYRTGNMTGQAAINAIGGMSYSTVGNNILRVTYANNNFSVSVGYRLIGGTVGDSDIYETITVSNLTSSALNMQFFQYSDFDLLGTASGDTARVDGTAGDFYSATQFKLSSQISETIVAPSGLGAEANDAATLLAKINNPGAIYNLNNNLEYFGDAAWALQWSLSVGGNSFMDIVKDKRLRVDPIPEPGTLALLLLGAGAVALRRRA